MRSNYAHSRRLSAKPIAIIYILALLTLLSFRAFADLDDAAGEYAKNPGANPSTQHTQERRALGETEPDPEREAVRRAKKSRAKTVVEGNAPGGPVEIGEGGSLGKSLQISSLLEYVGPRRKIKTERTVHLSDENREWVSLIHPRDGVALVGRVVERSPANVKLEYMIIDTSREDEGVISPPILQAPIGERLQVNLDGQGAKVSLQVEAKWRKQ